MNKLRLDLDSLTVESMPTGPAFDIYGPVINEPAPTFTDPGTACNQDTIGCLPQTADCPSEGIICVPF